MSEKQNYVKFLSEYYKNYIETKIAEQKKFLIKEDENFYTYDYKMMESDLAQKCGLGDITITNRIKEKIEEYCEKNNVNKGWIAEKLHLSKQALSESFKSSNPRLDTLIKISILINCNLLELFDYEVEYKQS